MKVNIRKSPICDVSMSVTLSACLLQHLAIACHWSQRASVIGDVIQVYSGSHGRTIVFCETKREATELSMSTSIKQVRQLPGHTHASGRGQRRCNSRLSLRARRRCTETSPRSRGRSRSRASGTAPLRCWWPPTWRRAAWTSPRWIWSFSALLQTYVHHTIPAFAYLVLKSSVYSAESVVIVHTMNDDYKTPVLHKFPADIISHSQSEAAFKHLKRQT